MNTTINKILIWTVIVDIFVHLCDVIDLMDDVWIEEDIKVLVDMFVINVWAADMVIVKLAGVYVDGTIDFVSEVGVEALTDANTNMLVTAMMEV